MTTLRPSRRSLTERTAYSVNAGLREYKDDSTRTHLQEKSGLGVWGASEAREYRTFFRHVAAARGLERGGATDQPSLFEFLGLGVLKRTTYLLLLPLNQSMTLSEMDRL